MNEHIGKPFDVATLAALLIRITGFQAAVPSTTVDAATTDGAPGVIEVAGLEVGAALSRMSGMRSLYVRSAQDFSNALPAAVEELRSLLQAADHTTLLLRLHTLKGNAATLGISDLARQVAEAEAVCKSTHATGHCAAALDDLDRLVPSVLLRLERAAALLGTPESKAYASSQTAGIPITRVVDALQSLAPLLATSNLEALHCYEKVQPLVATQHCELVDQLDAAMHDLNFAQAHATCMALLAQWQPARLEPG
jgi:HPt (histidine-containing phosphotransfer) domain-containing protein